MNSTYILHIVGDLVHFCPGLISKKSIKDGIKLKSTTDRSLIPAVGSWIPDSGSGLIQLKSQLLRILVISQWKMFYSLEL